MPADQIGVLALPAKTGGGGERLFHDRGGVDEDFHLGARQPLQPSGDGFQAALDELVIVAVLRVDGDGGAWTCS